MDAFDGELLIKTGGEDVDDPETKVGMGEILEGRLVRDELDARAR